MLKITARKKVQQDNKNKITKKKKHNQSDFLWDFDFCIHVDCLTTISAMWKRFISI